MFERTAREYALFRCRPPQELAPLLMRFARCASPPSVVDLGCGTGLSTELWRGVARRVVGVDRSSGMLRQARRIPSGALWLQADGAATGLPCESADIVIAVQSLHWMEPTATLREVSRILREGGVLAAVDTRFPPAIDPELDRVFERFLARAEAYLGSSTPRWSKTAHLRRFKECTHFRHVREVQLHAIEHGDAERFVGFAESAVDLPALRQAGASDAMLGLDVLRACAERVIGADGCPWTFGFRVRMAVK